MHFFFSPMRWIAWPPDRIRNYGHNRLLQTEQRNELLRLHVRIFADPLIPNCSPPWCRQRLRNDRGVSFGGQWQIEHNSCQLWGACFTLCLPFVMLCKGPREFLPTALLAEPFTSDFLGGWCVCNGWSLDIPAENRYWWLSKKKRRRRELFPCRDTVTLNAHSRAFVWSSVRWTCLRVVGALRNLCHTWMKINNDVWTLRNLSKNCLSLGT